MKTLNDIIVARLNSAFGQTSQAALPIIGALRRQTLVMLRWGAVIGQTLALLIVSQILGFSYPLIACAVVISASVIVNLAVTFVWPLDRRVSDFEAFMQLGFDLLQLAALLWLTGGITNPFSILFLAPVVTASVTLSRWVFFALGTLALALSFSLIFFHLPLPWNPDGSFELPLVFRIGVWVAISVGSIFTSLYAWRTTRESRNMSVALATTETLLAHEKKLSALGGLAAAAAHELGTPLSTIQIVAKEMSRELDKDSALGEDAALILSQSQRCRDILEQLADRGDQGDMIHDILSPEDLLEEAAEPYINRNIDIIIHANGSDKTPQLRRQPELLYALKNYVDNAVDFADSRVELSAIWDENALIIHIDDDGQGFDPSLFGRLGQPYATTRARARAQAGTNQKTFQKTGLGLGIFISATLIERTGGKVRYQRSDLGGARITARWPSGILN